MTFPCSFDWKLLVDFIKVLLSFPVVVLLLGLIFLNRYREEIRKKILTLAKASIAGNDAEFNVELAAAVAVKTIVEGTTHNSLRLMSYVQPSVVMAIKSTSSQLFQAGKDGNDPTELLKHEQEWITLTLKIEEELVNFYGRERVLQAIQTDITGIMNVYKGAFRNRSLAAQ